MGRTFDRLAGEIERYEGLLEKFMGDAVLAVFGVPRAHEDDAERAVRAALEMHAVLSELNRGFSAEGKPALEMRIGIEAGEVLVDVERASGPRDRMLTGDAVNTAARLQIGRRTRPDRRGTGRVCRDEGRDRVPRARAAHTEGQGRARSGLGGARGSRHGPAASGRTWGSSRDWSAATRSSRF